MRYTVWRRRRLEMARHEQRRDTCRPTPRLLHFSRQPSAVLSMANDIQDFLQGIVVQITRERGTLTLLGAYQLTQQELKFRTRSEKLVGGRLYLRQRDV